MQRSRDIAESTAARVTANRRLITHLTPRSDQFAHTRADQLRINVSPYVYGPNTVLGSLPHANFPDTGTSELTDGTCITDFDFANVGYAGMVSNAPTNLVDPQPRIEFNLGGSFNLSSIDISYLAQIDPNLGPRDGVADTSTLDPTPATYDDHVKISTSIDGVNVAQGDYIGMLDGRLEISAPSPESALKSILEKVGLSGDAVVTLYQGEDASAEAAEELRLDIQQQTPGVQVDLVYGAQPHYPYLASVE